MKRNYFYGVLLLFLIACQSDESIERIDENSGLPANGAVFELLMRSVQNPTAFDDFIDQSSAVRIEFPFEVRVNTLNNLVLNNPADYQTLINLLQQTPEADLLSLGFPANLSGVNFNGFTVNTQSQLDNLLNSLPASSEINCVNFIYPLEVRFFNAQNTLIDAQEVTNDAVFFNLLNQLSEGSGFFQLSYPLQVEFDGQLQNISSNAELNTAINALPQSCFEPLLFENNPVDIMPDDPQDFINFITNGVFVVSELIDDDDDNITAEFNGFSFVFNPDNTITVTTPASNQLFGEWLVFQSNNELIFDLDFDDSVLGELDDDWNVQLFNSLIMRLIDESTDGDLTRLTFLKL
ncbi:MAG: hypothetical protein RQ756_02305 [Flavobacteriaceae bacterium]|nr:hypothetical protein [Flavobacteriaceae bacterium]